MSTSPMSSPARPTSTPAYAAEPRFKAVQPVLVPELSYKPLAIREGTGASETWDRMVSGELDKEAAYKIACDLAAYRALLTCPVY